jgi:hypothetical protein
VRGYNVRVQRIRISGIGGALGVDDGRVSCREGLRGDARTCQRDGLQVGNWLDTGVGWGWLLFKRVKDSGQSRCWRGL